MTTAGATLDAYSTLLGRTLAEVRDRIDRAAAAAGGSASSVRLVAVTKGHPLEAVDAALAAGLADFGENRVQELEEKISARGREVATWHMIGHLQRRKARSVIPLADLVHSVDSVRLAERLSALAVEEGAQLAVLCQLNTSGEGSKGGFEGASALDQVHQVAELPGLRVKGLMTMAPFVDDQSVLATAFAGLREASERLRGATDAVGPELSMGMTNDLEIAIREGSTMVRIGTALFGPRSGSPP